MLLAWLYALYLAAIIASTATFVLAPPEFIQATLYLLGRSSAPILARIESGFCAVAFASKFAGKFVSNERNIPSLRKVSSLPSLLTSKKT